MKVNLTVEQAIDCLNNGEYIHVYVNNGILLGTDWERAKIIELFNQAEHIEIGGKMCRSMKHGIVVFPKGAKYQSDLYFVECDDNKLAQYDTSSEEEEDD